MRKDYYKILGVSETYTKAELKQKYNQLVKKYHPDLNPNNKEAEDKFKEVSEAYQVLSNPEARKKYDESQHYNPGENHTTENPFYGHTQREGGGRYTHSYSDAFQGEDFSDIFENLFKQRGENNEARKGTDIHYRMDIDFKDAILGAEKVFAMNDGKNIQVKIPPGIKSGQKLRFPHKGNSGKNPGMDGDLYVEIHVLPDLAFKRIGDDLEIQIPVLFTDALLGAKIDVPTIDGKIQMTLPPGTSSEARLRIKGKGVQRVGNPGDLYVKIKIKIPKVTNPEFINAVKEWQQSSEGKNESKNL